MTPDPLTTLAAYHPVVIEGMGGYDPRDPAVVAGQIAAALQRHWANRPVSKPRLVIIQGDPLEPRGISAITPRVAEHFGLGRALVCLDEAIAPYHARDADRNNVVLELRYSQLAETLRVRDPQAIDRLEAAVAAGIEARNQKREALGKPPLKHWFRDFALLQEVTKAASRAHCGEITVAHTAREISEFSVTGFYTVGLELGLVGEDELVRPQA
ncbi:shikimate kinase [Spiribacter onubensis]|uniref:Shikimate kinase n=1 Tax=Spiribacter onubensis TaxID=3122420 RepID=A0ABV3SB62_9GAMM